MYSVAQARPNLGMHLQGTNGKNLPKKIFEQIFASTLKSDLTYLEIKR